MTFDPRITLARPDLASASLEGRIRADRFADPIPNQSIAPAASIRAAPGRDAEQVDQLLFGEVFDVLEHSGGYAWGQARRDGYVGFVESAALSLEVRTPSHWIAALRAYAFAEPSIKAAAAGPLSLNALIAVDFGVSGPLAHLAGLGWVAKAHIAPIGESFSDPAAVAESLLGAPYLWGGRDSLGLDCSGLVQQALYACGQACPRDADQQARLGIAIDVGSLRRNDLVCWRGHIGMLLDSERLIHANAHHMAVAIEPLAQAISRIEAGDTGPPTTFRRLGGYLANS